MERKLNCESSYNVKRVTKFIFVFQIVFQVLLCECVGKNTEIFVVVFIEKQEKLAYGAIAL